MQFFSINSVQNTMKSMKLNMEWSKRKANPFLEKKDEVSPEIKRLREDVENNRKASIIGGIDAKLKGGSKLTNDELEYLRENAPELYKVAIKVKREREQYEKELKNCKTKEDVERLNTRKMQQFMTELKAVTSNPNIPEGKKLAKAEEIMRRVMGILGEHTEFVKSDEYAELPTEQEILEDEKKAEKKKAKKAQESSDDAKRLMEMLDKATKGEDINDMLSGELYSPSEVEPPEVDTQPTEQVAVGYDETYTPSGAKSKPDVSAPNINVGEVFSVKV